MTELLQQTTRVVSAYLGNHEMSVTDIPTLINSVHVALSTASAPEPVALAVRPPPAVPISKSVQDTYIVCLEDGKRLKMLKRYLMARYGLTPDEYRRRWGLKPEYPMTAPAYAAARSNFAKTSGLGKRVRGHR